MPDFRVFCLPPSPAPATLVLSPGESHHLVGVNRARPGDPVVAFDGRGHEWGCLLDSARRDAAELRVVSAHTAPPRGPALTLGQALPKGGGMEGVVRKATELGAARIVPLITARTEVRLDEERSARKAEKWRTAALEAAKQCGNPWLPEIEPVRELAPYLASAPEELKLIAGLHPGALSLKAALAAFGAAHGRPPASVLCLIGPEGDFTPGEMTQAGAAGFAAVTLGPLVLRCETAATCVLGVLGHELRPA